MANYKSISTAAISVLAGWEVWNGSAWVAASAIPAAGDVAYANGFNKEIDQNWTVDEIRNNVFQGTTGSGRFELLSAGITFNGERYSNASNVLYISFGGGTSTVLGQGFVLAGGLTPATAGVQIVGLAGGILNLEYSGNGTPSNSIGTFATGNGGGFEIVCVNAAGNDANVRCYGFICDGSNYVLKFTGQQIAGEGNTCRAVMLMGSNNTYINQGYATGAATIVDSRVHPAVQNTSELNNIINEGILEGGPTNPAIWSFTGIISNTQTIANNIQSRYVNTNSIINKGVIIEGVWPAIYTVTSQISNTSDAEVIFRTDTVGVTKSMYTAGLLTGYPPEAKVEDGEVYGPSGEFTGELSPVNVDTAQLATDLFDAIIASSDPLAVRLKNTATVSTVNDAIGSLNVIP